MILAAGLGTRLKPLTDHKPKVLLRAGEYTLLEFAIKKLQKYGFNDLIINIHHHGNQIIEYLIEHDNFGCNITISDETNQLLNTGGAIRKAAHFLNDQKPFIVYNADIISNIDLFHLYEYHIETGGLATLVVRRRETSRYLLFDELMQLTEWQNREKGLSKIVRITEKPPKPFAFSGIHVISPAIFNLLPNNEAFSIIDAYLEIARVNRIVGYVDESSLFADAGKPDSLAEAGRIAAEIKL